MPFQSIYRADLFANRTVIVTGGGSGTGRCISHELASLGARVAIVGRTEEKLQTVAAEIAADGGSCHIYPGDIRDEARVKEIVAEVVGKTGAIAGLVNNAGGQFPSPLARISKKGFNAVLQTNTLGTFQFSREVYLQAMQESGGSIVNITANCERGAPGLGHSAAARAAVENFTKTAAVEWGPAGVRVNCVAPGFIATSGADSYESESETGRRFVQMLRDIVGHVPMKRTGTESEISAAVCFLLSDAAAYVTGDALRVDGALGLSSGWHTLGPGAGSAPFRGFHRAVQPRLFGGPGDGAR